MRTWSSFVHLADGFLIFLFRAEKTEVLSEDLLQVRLPGSAGGQRGCPPCQSRPSPVCVTVSCPHQVCGETGSVLCSRPRHSGCQLG